MVQGILLNFWPSHGLVFVIFVIIISIVIIIFMIIIIIIIKSLPLSS